MFPSCKHLLLSLMLTNTIIPRQSTHQCAIAKAEPPPQTTTNTCSTACSILFIPKYQNSQAYAEHTPVCDSQSFTYNHKYLLHSRFFGLCIPVSHICVGGEQQCKSTTQTTQNHSPPSRNTGEVCGKLRLSTTLTKF